MKILTLLTSRIGFMLGAGSIALAMAFMPAFSQAAELYRQLELGMSGSDVSDLQIFLSQDVTIYPLGRVTGYFGLLTKAAVSNFQARNGISVVGRVGPITLAAINLQMNGDVSAPLMSSFSLSTSNTTASFDWFTSENTSAKVFYSESQIPRNETASKADLVIPGVPVVENSYLTSSHALTVTGLEPHTTYNYMLYARDASGNETVTVPLTFRTN